MRIALYEPDIAPNVGTILRLGACLGVPVDVIEPCGFPLSDRALKRAGMDYIETAEMVRHDSWEAFLKQLGDTPPRLVLMTTKAETGYTDFEFRASDVVLMGSETAGVPDEVHALADARLKIPMVKGMRSLNIAISCAMAIGEAQRQTGTSFPSG